MVVVVDAAGPMMVMLEVRAVELVLTLQVPRRSALVVLALPVKAITVERRRDPPQLLAVVVAVAPAQSVETAAARWVVSAVMVSRPRSQAFRCPTLVVAVEVVMTEEARLRLAVAA